VVDDGRYAIVLLKRQRLGGVLYRVGQVVLIRGLRHLRVAAHLVRVGAARPADQRTARDVEVYLALQAAVDSNPAQGFSSRTRPA
jgi:hypothetical protein